MPDKSRTRRPSPWPRRPPTNAVDDHHLDHGMQGNGRSPWLLARYCDIDDILDQLIALGDNHDSAE